MAAGTQTTHLKGSTRQLQLPPNLPSFGNSGLQALGLINRPTFGGTVTGGGSSMGSSGSDATILAGAATTSAPTTTSSAGFTGEGGGSGFAIGRTGDATGDAAAGSMGSTTGSLGTQIMPNGVAMFDSDAMADSISRFGAQFGNNIGGGGAGAGTIAVQSIGSGTGINGASGTSEAASFGGGQGVGTNNFVGAAGGLGSGQTKGSAIGGGTAGGTPTSTFTGQGNAVGNFNQIGAASFGYGGTLPSVSFGQPAPNIGGIVGFQAINPIGYAAGTPGVVLGGPARGTPVGPQGVSFGRTPYAGAGVNVFAANGIPVGNGNIPPPTLFTP